MHTCLQAEICASTLDNICAIIHRQYTEKLIRIIWVAGVVYHALPISIQASACKFIDKAKKPIVNGLYSPIKRIAKACI